MKVGDKVMVLEHKDSDNPYGNDMVGRILDVVSVNDGYIEVSAIETEYMSEAFMLFKDEYVLMTEELNEYAKLVNNDVNVIEVLSKMNADNI